jgi:hypothetical protein
LSVTGALGIVRGDRNDRSRRRCVQGDDQSVLLVAAADDVGAGAGLAARQLDGTALASPAASVQVQLMTLEASAALAGINTSTGSGVAPVYCVATVTRPPSAMWMLRT